MITILRASFGIILALTLGFGLLLVPFNDTDAAEFTIVSETGPETEEEFGKPILTGRNAATPCHIRLEGDIVAGDLDRLKQILSQIRARRGDEYPRHVGICLNSSGGSYMEAIRIAKAMLGKTQSGEPVGSQSEPLRTWTVVSEHDECYSACAVIFLAGNVYIDDEMMGPTYSRHLHIRGKLGFHSPYLAFPTAKNEAYGADTVKQAFREGALAVRELTKLGSQVNFSGQSDDPDLMPQPLINEMLARGEGDLYYVDRVGKAVRYKIDLFGGLRPTSVGFCEYDNICVNAHNKELISTSDRLDDERGSQTINCSKYWKTVNQRYLYSGDGGTGGTGGYGGEGLMHCVLGKSGAATGGVQYYSELVKSTKTPLDQYNFQDAPWFYYYSPSTFLNALK